MLRFSHRHVHGAPDGREVAQQEACSVSSKFSKLAPAILAELKFKPEGNGNDFVDFSVSNISVCFEVKAWAEGYPEGALRHYVKVAGAGRVVTVIQQKKLVGVSECRISACNVAAHARSFSREDHLTLSEEQPNTRQYENVAGEVTLTKHIDPFIALCRRCKLAVTVKKSATSATCEPCDSAKLCGSVAPSADTRRTRVKAYS